MLRAMMPDIGLHLDDRSIDGSIRDESWVASTRKRFGSLLATYEDLASRASADGDVEDEDDEGDEESKECRFSAFLKTLEAAHAKLVCQLVVQQAITMRAVLWTK